MDVVLYQKRFDRGYVMVTQNHVRGLEERRLVPMGPKLWQGAFLSKARLSLGDEVDIGDHLPGIMGKAMITTAITMDVENEYLFEGTGALEVDSYLECAMTIEPLVKRYTDLNSELEKKKEVLEAKLILLFQQFFDDTGLLVESVRSEFIETTTFNDEFDKYLITGVDVRVRLPSSDQ